jgi:hypothetical protein
LDPTERTTLRGSQRREPESERLELPFEMKVMNVTKKQGNQAGLALLSSVIIPNVPLALRTARF